MGCYIQESLSPLGLPSVTPTASPQPSTVPTATGDDTLGIYLYSYSTNVNNLLDLGAVRIAGIAGSSVVILVGGVVGILVVVLILLKVLKVSLSLTCSYWYSHLLCRIPRVDLHLYNQDDFYNVNIIFRLYTLYACA